ncbi:hypothetical protein AB4114_12375 [Paenibacillus sp. 2RAB27]|uniref:hypothetical protein n=1 Tax=Paenibacillus sp. 2RAB27 TaxID=3232991 RepID=UPI003F9B439A
MIASNQAKAETQRMLRAVQHALLILHPPEEAGEEVRKLTPLVQDKLQLGGRATAYVCQNFACQAPTQDIADLENLSTQH